jgi:hypothetical protein
MSQNISREFTKIILSPEKITKNDYNNFWKQTGITSQQEKINFIVSMKNSFMAVQEYNRDVWDCAEKSWIANKEIDCPKLKKSANNLKNIFNNSAEIDKFKEMEKNFTELIKVSSRRGDNSDTSTNGSKVFKQITLADIKKTKEDTKKILERTDIILQPEFISSGF